MDPLLLRQRTDESVFATMNFDDDSHILDGASEDGIVAPIPHDDITRNDFGQLEIVVQLAKKKTCSGAESLTMIVKNGKYPELEFHRATRYNELLALARKIKKQSVEEVALAFPDSFCDKTSTLTRKCTIARTTHIEQYFINVINVYREYGCKEKDKFLEFLQDRTKWKVVVRPKRNNTYEGGKKTRKRNRKRKGGKKTRKRRRKRTRNTKKRKRSLKKRRIGRKRTKRRR